MPILKNVKHETFVQGIIRGLCGRAAYLEAGYKCSDRAAETSSSDLLKKPEILARIEELQSRSAEKAALTRAWVLQRLMKNADISLGNEKLTVQKAVKSRIKDEDGGFTEAYATVELEMTDRDAAAANRALELLGREVDGPAMFVERKEVGQPGDFDHMTDDELERQYETFSERIGGGGKGRPRTRAQKKPQALH